MIVLICEAKPILKYEVLVFTVFIAMAIMLLEMDYTVYLSEINSCFFN